MSERFQYQHSALRGFGDELPLYILDNAKCAEADPNIFYPERGQRNLNVEAKKICMTCTVRTPCLDFAIDNQEVWGIWGGLNKDERDRVRRKRKLRGGN